MATVSIIRATYSDPDIETLLALLGGMERFVKKNEKVLLKGNPNVANVGELQRTRRRESGRRRKDSAEH